MLFPRLNSFGLIRLIEDQSVLLHLEKGRLLFDDLGALYKNLIDVSSNQVYLIWVRVVIVLAVIELLGIGVVILITAYVLDQVLNLITISRLSGFDLIPTRVVRELLQQQFVCFVDRCLILAECIHYFSRCNNN